MHDDYTPQEKALAELAGLSGPAELYDLAVIEYAHKIILAAQDINRVIQDKSSYKDRDKERLKHILEFFVTDLTKAIGDILPKKGGNNDNGGESPEPTIM